MLNFLHSKLKPTIICNCVCEDDYPANNLISNKPNQGFMAFSVTKPPIDLTFNLPHQVEIHQIKLWTSIGALKSTGFEVKIRNNEGIECRIGSAFNITEECITFCRNPIDLSMGKQIQFFRYSQRILDKVTTVIVTIKTTKKCPPVLRKIEIWGLPAQCLNKLTKEKILKIWDDTLYTSPNTNEKISKKTKEEIQALSLIDTNDVPEDFLDEITYNIMIFPMVLPSGKMVDQSTIDRHSQTEEKWGRLPSDPFTGQIFTKDRKPILNLLLKSRIEEYLLKNSYKKEIQSLPRVLGRPIKRRSQPSETQTLSSTLIHLEPKPKRIKVENFMSKTSLEDEIKFALKGIKRYSQISSATEKTDNDNDEDEDDANNHKIEKVIACLSCKSNDNLYRILVCKHLVCKPCLVELSHKNLCSCQTTFKTNEIEKYYI
ncbi:RING finger protein 37 [Condylostylus longicornis]|uniref:RING finger protein 37 n=1 Tax=Condylostylus longicornis TaxID=2530218 RepID=UPI00244DA0D4|nr:RING finger protein 37 [Condylostylus longicornis]